MAQWLALDRYEDRIAVLVGDELCVHEELVCDNLEVFASEPHRPSARRRLNLHANEAASADAVIALGETAEGAAFLKQVAALPGHPVVIGHRDFGAKSVLEEAGAAAEGVLIVTEYMPALDAERQSWAQAFRHRHGAEPSVIAAQHYDAVVLLAEAMKRTGPTRPQVKAGLQQLRGFRGVMADYTFDAGPEGVHRFYVVRIRGGTPSLETVLDERP